VGGWGGGGRGAPGKVFFLCYFLFQKTDPRTGLVAPAGGGGVHPPRKGVGGYTMGRGGGGGGGGRFGIDPRGAWGGGRVSHVFSDVSVCSVIRVGARGGGGEGGGGANPPPLGETFIFFGCFGFRPLAGVGGFSPASSETWCTPRVRGGGCKLRVFLRGGGGGGGEKRFGCCCGLRWP